MVLVHLAAVSVLVLSARLSNAADGFSYSKMSTALGASIGAYSSCGSIWAHKSNSNVEQFTVKVFDKTVSAVLQNAPFSEDQMMVLAVRGTNNNIQLASEIKSYLLDPPKDFNLPGISKSVSVLGYFATAADGLWAQIKPKIAERGNMTEILVTGHSLGGAVGALLALRIATEFQEIKLSFYSFGEPRVGDNIFSNMFDLWVPNGWRVVHYNDIVPHIPPCLTNILNPLECTIGPKTKYHHGTEVWFPKEDGNYNLGSNSIDNMSDFKVCTGAPMDEDLSCANSLPITSLSTESHMIYFGVRLDTAGSAYC